MISRTKMQRTKIVLSAFVALFVVAGTFGVLGNTSKGSKTVHGLALPFQTDDDHDYSVTASMLKMGQKDVVNTKTNTKKKVEVRLFQFKQENEVSQILRGTNDSDHIDIVETPDSQTVSINAPLSVALQGEVMGYIFTTVDGKIEKDNSKRTGLRFKEKFPGTFFSSYRNPDIEKFEKDNDIPVKSVNDLKLMKNASYVVVSQGPSSFQVRGIVSPLNKASNPMDVNDDGVVNRADMDRLIEDINNNGASRSVNTTMKGPPYFDVNNDWNISPLDALNISNFLATIIDCEPNGVLQDFEQCDDGNKVDNDYCSNTCKLPALPF